MPNIVNQMTVRDLERQLSEVDGMIFVTFGGLDVVQTEAIRNGVAEKGAGFRMLRNKLARRVLADRGLEFDAEVFQGNTAVAFGDAEAVIGAAKVLTEKEIKKTNLVSVKAGVMEGQALSSAEAAQLADLPDRDTVNAMLLGVISGPARSLATVINAVPASVARVLQAHVDDQGGADGAPAE